MIITTEKAIKLAQNYIQRNEIEDQDLQQDIYLAALEWKSKVDNGYSRSFSQYADRIVKSKQDCEELAYDLYDAFENLQYIYSKNKSITEKNRYIFISHTATEYQMF